MLGRRQTGGGDCGLSRTGRWGSGIDATWDVVQGWTARVWIQGTEAVCDDSVGLPM